MKISTILMTLPICGLIACGKLSTPDGSNDASDIHKQLLHYLTQPDPEVEIQYRNQSCWTDLLNLDKKGRLIAAIADTPRKQGESGFDYTAYYELNGSIYATTIEYSTTSKFTSSFHMYLYPTKLSGTDEAFVRRHYQ